MPRIRASLFRMAQRANETPREGPYVRRLGTIPALQLVCESKGSKEETASQMTDAKIANVEHFAADLHFSLAECESDVGQFGD